MAKKSPDAYNKAAMIVAIQKLLQNKLVGTQDEICHALQQQGFSANQVKVSRILHKIGAIKINENNQIVYRLPNEMVVISPKDTLKQLILNISHNETLIVIQTMPGSASLVARLLDLKKDEDVLGTVAGDDTIFIAPTKIKQINSVYQKIYQLLLN